MRKLWPLLLLLSVLTSGYSQSYHFSSVCESGQTLYYKILSDSITHTVKVVTSDENYPLKEKGIEPSGYLRIPDMVNHNGTDYSVVAIGKSAFTECDQLTSVIIGAYVEIIEEQAFSYCSSLTTINFGSSLVGIGWGAFYGCINIDSLVLPEPLSIIGEAAFYNCKGITSVIFPATLNSIESNAFADCSGLYSLYIPRSVSYIDFWAFHGNTSLTSIDVEEGNLIYDSRNGCNAIIETAHNQLLKGCKTTIIPDNVVEIGQAAFFDCTGMNEVIIPSSVKIIRNNAFSRCTDLVSVQIPNSVTSIEDGAFSSSGLISVHIPESVTTMGINPFASCQDLTIITVDPFNPVFDSRENCNAIILTSQNNLVAGCKSTTIPNSIKYIGENAFYYCQSLTSIIIPRSVKSIGKKAFYHCSNLISLTLPSSVTTLGEGAFEYCGGLQCIFARRPICPNTGFSALFALGNNVKVHIPKGSLNSYVATWYQFQHQFSFIEEYMLPEGGEWWYNMRDAVGNRYYQHLEYVYDTLMNDLSVKVIVKESLGARGESVVSHEYIYEDSCRLFRWNNEKELFGVLYDYSAQPGDEWQVALEEDVITVQVDTVITMTLGDAEYDVMRVHDNSGIMSGEIICGVGHKKSFFPEIESSIWGVSTDGMRCFWKDDNLLLHFGDTDCDAIMFVDETPVFEDITLYPNPTNGYVTISSDGLNHVIVFSLLGQVVYESDINGNEVQLDLSQLNAGVYLVRVTSNTTACGISKLLVKSMR